MHESEKWKWSRSVVSNSSRPHGLQPTRLLHPWDFPGKSTGVGCHCLLRWSCIHTGIFSFVRCCHCLLQNLTHLLPSKQCARMFISKASHSIKCCLNYVAGSEISVFSFHWLSLRFWPRLAIPVTCVCMCVCFFLWNVCSCSQPILQYCVLLLLLIFRMFLCSLILLSWTHYNVFSRPGNFSLVVSVTFFIIKYCWL